MKNKELIKRYDFDSFFKENYSSLVLFAYKIVKDRMSSEDIVQDAFKKVLEDNSFNRIDNIRAYFYSVVRNKAIDFLRAKNKAIDISDVENIDFEKGADESYLESEVHVRVLKAVDSLPDKCRKIFWMNTIEGVTMKEIAEHMGISINTVKSQKTRALTILREKINITLIYIARIKKRIF